MGNHRTKTNTSELFSATAAPLADRVRPTTLAGFFGQSRLLGEGGLLRRLIERDRIPSLIFWGGPGSGKTTLAGIIARRTGGELVSLSAVSAGVAEVRKVIEAAAANRSLGRRTILFIDEIHRFNKAQQDALLHAVEDGTIVLIGATTENPSFEVIGPLLSRCRVIRFERLSDADIKQVVQRAVTTDPRLQALGPELAPGALEMLAEYANGDARLALNALETAVELAVSERDASPASTAGVPNASPTTVAGDLASSHPTVAGGGKGGVVLTLPILERALMARPGQYDKAGDFHYDVISAFIKSMRGSDPDGAVYWLARMIEAGEDPLFIARRMVVLASEDIGNANPTALVLAQACADAVHFIGMPEGRITLAQTAIYLACSPKSNAGYKAIEAALADVRDRPEREVPLHLRNAVTGLMKRTGYGEGYKYAHDYEGGFAEQQHLPDDLKDRVYYEPTDRGAEKAIKERLEGWRRRPSEDWKGEIGKGGS